MHLEVITRRPTSQPRPTPLLFVHGAWHAAWCWEAHFLDYFASRGYTAHALSLRGHGASEGRNRLRWTRISEYVADVAQVIAAMPIAPIVIGHSMGGFVLQKYLETHRAPAGVLLASVPPAGALAATLRLAARQPVAFAKANLTLRLWPLVATPALAREAFFSASMPDAQLRELASRLQDESYCAFLDLLALDLPHPGRVQTPLLVLGGADDTIFSPADVAATARAYRTQPVMFPGLAHDMMLEEGWEKVADHIRAWIEAMSSPHSGG
jgi:pimeloyl-ACP methyl ester carboxylesterase